MPAKKRFENTDWESKSKHMKTDPRTYSDAALNARIKAYENAQNGMRSSLFDNADQLELLKKEQIRRKMKGQES